MTTLGKKYKIPAPAPRKTVRRDRCQRCGNVYVITHDGKMRKHKCQT